VPSTACERLKPCKAAHPEPGLRLLQASYEVSRKYVQRVRCKTLPPSEAMLRICGLAANGGSAVARSSRYRRGRWCVPWHHMAKAAVPHMTNGSAIVMTGSVTGLLGNKNLLDYSTTKGGIHAFVRSLAMHLIDKGIRVNAVAPGPVWTPLNPADRDAKGVSKFGEDSPMKRPAQPEEIAPAFVFLAAPRCA
jgi:NAD(P)-dependent dehydrogenase (short-subunit alcohol dehydrogenase family)